MSDPIDPNNDPNESDGMRNLREARDRAVAEAAKNAAAARKLAFIEAGVDMANPTSELLLNSYEGELTPEAIKTAAEKYNLVKVADQVVVTPEPGSSHDPAQSQQRQQLQSEVIDPAAPPERGDPIAEGYAQFHEDRAKGATAAEASGAVFGRILGEAYSGNKDFIHDAQAWRDSEEAKSR